ncbi:hypothetical protein PLESTF_001514500 [Pleodorina starrii]|nr:hypothetical protein PLESTF_001514500 [Pleodorina starrii]
MMFFSKKKSIVVKDAPKRSNPLKEFVDDHGEFVEKALAVGVIAAVPAKILFGLNSLRGQMATLQGQMVTLEGQMATVQRQMATLEGRMATLATQTGSVLAAVQRVEALTKRGPE